jgi:hypothetical protein
MQASKKAKPAGACNVCHALTAVHEQLNQRCNQVVGGRRCSGNYKSALTDLWDECESCQATGKVGSEACAECAGFGWRLYA